MTGLTGCWTTLLVVTDLLPVVGVSVVSEKTRIDAKTEEHGSAIPRRTLRFPAVS